MNKLITALVFILSITSAHSGPYKLKGFTLGDKVQKACADYPIVDQQKLIDDFDLENVSFPSVSCKINIETIAGVKTSDPLILLFWKGELTRMIVKFESISLEDFAELISTLNQTYGKSKNTLGLFPTSTWRNGSQELFLERTRDFPSDIGLYLTDLPSWKEREAESTKIKNSMKNKMKKSRIDDLMN